MLSPLSHGPASLKRTFSTLLIPWINVQQTWQCASQECMPGLFKHLFETAGFLHSGLIFFTPA